MFKETYSEEYLGPAQVRISLPAVRRNTVRPNSAAAVSVMRVKRNGCL